MKRILLTGYLSFLSMLSMGQSASAIAIQDSVLGWMKIYHLKGTKEGRKMDDRYFSAAQLSIADSFVNWIQASYIPKAGIGDTRKSIFPKANQYRPYESALPQGYGATAYTWNVSYESGKLKPIPETESSWNILANSVPAGWAIPSLCDKEHFYFTMPGFDNSTDPNLKKEQDISHVENIKPYIYAWIQNIETGGGTENVFLCKNNRLPFNKITKGEYLAAIEKGIAKAFEDEKKKIYRDNAGNAKSIDYFMQYLNEKNAKRIACLKNNKEKYKDRFQEIAEVFSAQPDIMLENYPDVFDGNDAKAFKLPVYRLDPSMYELCKKDQPQWIRITWGWNAGDPKTKHTHESTINNFNFKYVYNFFFDPGKIKGISYAPLRSPYTKEKAEITALSGEAKKAATDDTIFFFEDFSANAEGQKPMDWYAQMSNTGENAMITTVENEKGKWLTIKGNAVIPKKLKNPFPRNFTLSYDVAVPGGFTWGAKSLELKLASQKTNTTNNFYISLRMRPGFDGNAGFAVTESKLPDGFKVQENFGAPGFSNNKKFNAVKVSITKKEESLEIYIGETKVAGYPKAIPAGMEFNGFSFSHGRSDADTEKYFISNIKISKD